MRSETLKNKKKISAERVYSAFENLFKVIINTKDGSRKAVPQLTVRIILR